MNRPFWLVCIGFTTCADLNNKFNLFNQVVDRGIEPLCQDWESCILTIRWIDQRYIFFEVSLRKVGDSNPRYGYPHGSLANCWFQPLTQPSSRKSLPNQQASFSNAVAKVLLFSGSTKFFSDYFSIKMHFFCNPLIFRTPFFGFFSSKMPFHGKMPIKVQKAPSWMQV